MIWTRVLGLSTFFGLGIAAIVWWNPVLLVMVSVVGMLWFLMDLAMSREIERQKSWKRADDGKWYDKDGKFIFDENEPPPYCGIHGG